MINEHMQERPHSQNARHQEKRTWEKKTTIREKVQVHVHSTTYESISHHGTVH